MKQYIVIYSAIDEFGNRRGTRMKLLHLIHMYNNRHTNIQNLNIKIEDLFGQHYIVVEMSNGDVEWFDLSKLLVREPIEDTQVTLKNYIENINPNTLRKYTYQNEPKRDPITKKYTDRVEITDGALYQSAFTNIKTPEIRNDIYRIGSLPDIVYSDVPNGSYLTVVNGVFHHCTHTNNELFVYGGYRNILNSKKIKVSVINTTPVGGHHIIKLRPEWVINTDEQSITNGVYLNIQNGKFSLKNRRMFLVIDGYLHALDDTYKMISDSILKIDTQKIDFIKEYLHNPNTRYVKDLRSRANPYTSDVIDFIPEPSISDKITYYLEHFDELSDTTHIGEFIYTDMYPTTPTIDQILDTYLKEFETITTNTQHGNVLLSEVAFAKTYTSLTQITPTIPIDSVNNERFIMERLTSEHTFIIVFDDPNIKINTYELQQKSISPNQYDIRSKDTPRGILIYPSRKVRNYVAISAEDGQHTIYTDERDPYENVYKSILNPAALPAPIYDRQKLHVSDIPKLLEIYR
jgi:hypothetical protein